MDRWLRNELNSCISELRSIVNELYAVSADISNCINGMNTKKFTDDLERTAEKYNNAVKKLKKIK